MSVEMLSGVVGDVCSNAMVVVLGTFEKMFEGRNIVAG
jgi:hypothetical protein